jgi:predicted nucleic acid-binding Zn ribbon protein
VKRRPSELEPLGALVPRVLRDLGLEGAALLRVVQCWEAAVGAEVAAHCRPAALRGTTLEARVDSSAWAQQLKLREPELLAALRDALGDAAPAALRFRVG